MSEKMTHGKIAERLRVSELDALRGIAAMGVLLFHLTHMDFSPQMAPYWLKSGHYGVELFFVISGFVIFMTLSGAWTLRAFIASRIARLYPAYWASIVILTSAIYLAEIIFGVTGHAFPPAEVAMNLTMLQTFFGVPDLDGSYWTLAVEIEFYVGIGCIFALGLSQRIDALCLVFLMAKNVYYLALVEFGWKEPLSTLYCIVQYGNFFVIGICLFRLRVAKRSYFTLLVLLGAILSAAWGGPFRSTLPGAIEYLGVTCGLTFLVWAAVNDRASILCWPPFVWLGGISYPLYLIHQRIGTDVRNLLSREGASDPVALAIAIFFVIGLAAGIHHGIETRFRHPLKALLERLPHDVRAGG